MGTADRLQGKWRLLVKGSGFPMWSRSPRLGNVFLLSWRNSETDHPPQWCRIALATGHSAGTYESCSINTRNHSTAGGGGPAGGSSAQIELASPIHGTRSFPVGPGGIDKGGAEGMRVLDGGAECCTGLRKEALWPWRLGAHPNLSPSWLYGFWQVNGPL